MDKSLTRNFSDESDICMENHGIVIRNTGFPQNFLQTIPYEFATHPLSAALPSCGFSFRAPRLSRKTRPSVRRDGGIGRRT
jgi:hypothetical protein